MSTETAINSKEMLKLNLEIPIEKGRLTSLLVSCCESGGSTYWAEFSKPRPSGSDYDVLYVKETDDGWQKGYGGSGKPWKGDVKAEDLLIGIKRLAENTDPNFTGAAAHLHAFLSENDDVETADVILQMTLFGKLIYG